MFSVQYLVHEVIVQLSLNHFLIRNMKVVKQFTWKVMPTSTPLYKRKCSKCKSSKLYYCSNKFRLNSQKKNIDVWLIYRCVKCDDTCNITILSRTKPELIDKELFSKFSNNDEATAWKYAFDRDIIRRNQMELDYSNVEFEIIGEDILLDDLVEMKEDTFEFIIKTNFDLDIKLTHVIRKGFNISSNQLEQMLSAGVITVLPLCSVKKCKVRDGIAIIVDRVKLKTYIEKMRTESE